MKLYLLVSFWLMSAALVFSVPTPTSIVHRLNTEPAPIANVAEGLKSTLNAGALGWVARFVHIGIKCVFIQKALNPAAE